MATRQQKAARLRGVRLVPVKAALGTVGRAPQKGIPLRRSDLVRDDSRRESKRKTG